jgi:ankyrin repeat protein
MNEKYAFEIAAFGTYESMIEMLNGIDNQILDQVINSAGYTLAGEASRFGNLETLTALADLGVDLEACDRDLGGEPPLHGALVQNHLEVIKFLLHKKVNLNSPGWMGMNGHQLLAKYRLSYPNSGLH